MRQEYKLLSAWQAKEFGISIYSYYKNVIKDIELTENAPSADSAAALNSLENQMNNFTVSSKVKPLKFYAKSSSVK